jgi:hypothetical protein
VPPRDGPPADAALREVKEAGLYGHFKREQFAGCFMPRHILWNPNRGLSMHAWGLAIDFNSIDNAFGKRPVMDPRIVRSSSGGASSGAATGAPPTGCTSSCRGSSRPPETARARADP